jgi:hypothetical protein
MKCNKAKKLLQEYLEGTLESAKKKKLEEHIKGCISCKKELESLNEYFTTMESIESISAPEEFLKSVRKRIEEAQKPKKIVPIRIKVPLELAGAVAAIVIAVIIFRNMLPVDLKTKRELQTPPRVVTSRAHEVPREHEAPQKSKTAKDESSAKETGKENLVSSLKKASGNEASEAPDDLKAHHKLSSPSEFSTQKELKTQRDIQTQEEFVYPRESETQKELKTQREMESPQGIPSPQDLTSEEKPLLPAPAAEKQAPVKLVLLLPHERPEPSASETPDEEIKMKRLSPDEGAPQRSAERDKESAAKKSSSKEYRQKITEMYDKEIGALKSSSYGPAAQKSVSEIEKLAKRLGGTIVSMEYTKEGDFLHFITLSMPTAKINEFIDGLNAFGKIEEKTPLEELKPYRGNTILISIELSIEE